MARNLLSRRGFLRAGRTCAVSGVLTIVAASGNVPSLFLECAASQGLDYSAVNLVNGRTGDWVQLTYRVGNAINLQTLEQVRFVFRGQFANFEWKVPIDLIDFFADISRTLPRDVPIVLLFCNPDAYVYSQMTNGYRPSILRIGFTVQLRDRRAFRSRLQYLSELYGIYFAAVDDYFTIDHSI